MSRCWSGALASGVGSLSAITSASLLLARGRSTAPSLLHGYLAVVSPVLRAAPTSAPHCPSSRRLAAPGPRPGSALPVVSLPGGRRTSPVPMLAVPPFHVPYAAGFFRAAFQALHPLHGLRPLHPGSAPRCPPRGGRFSTRQTSLNVADWWFAHPPEEGFPPRFIPKVSPDDGGGATKVAWSLL